ncbi:MAG: bis(5'-nucleosyl)-tetraphosphatase [Candidatus Kerfeldbacteria bacterium]|jgi:bis(5'-nucleosidyl)-tetraphosphatase
MIQVNSAGAIIYYNDNGELKFLLLQYIGKYWEYARGHVESGESKIDTARREISEETGLKNLNFVEGFQTKSVFQYEYKKKKHSKEVVLFLAESKSNKVKISHEHIGFVWLSAKEALKRITYANSKKAFKDALDFLKIKY